MHNFNFKYYCHHYPTHLVVIILSVPHQNQIATTRNAKKYWGRNPAAKSKSAPHRSEEAQPKAKAKSKGAAAKKAAAKAKTRA